MKIIYKIIHFHDNNFFVNRRVFDEFDAYVSSANIYQGSPADCYAYIKLLEEGYIKSEPL